MSDTSTESLTSAVREHHRALATVLDQYAENISDLEPSIVGDDVTGLWPVLDSVTAFLSGELLPHAQGEERTLYPALDPVLREHGRPTATMSIDHEYLSQHAQRIAALAERLRTADKSERAALIRQLQRETLQLQGLFHVHLEKEERVYLPLIEQAISAEEQQALFAALDDALDDALDVRLLPPTRRHALIFERFDALPIGGSFMLINDHDPKPLRYQLTAEYTGELLWDYLETRPEVWRVRLGKRS